MYKVPVYAHRGASGYALENSYAAFVKAKDLGADGLEIDLQLTKDYVPVVTHDIDLWRLAGTHKRVPDLLYKEIKKIRLGKNCWRRIKGETILTFEEVLQFSIENGLLLNVELKESFLHAPDHVYHLFKESYKGITVHYSSFHYEVLEKLKLINPLVETAYIGTKKLDWNGLSFLSAANSIHMHKRYYQVEKIELAASAKKKLRYYGIEGNEPFILNPHRNVDGWITDYPDRVIKLQKGILSS